MNRLLKILLLTSLLVGPAAAQEAWDEFDSVWQHKLSSTIGAVIAPDVDEPVLVALELDASANRVLDNGVEIGVVGQLGFQKDHPSRAGFAGVVSFDAAGPFYQDGFSGLATGSEPEDIGPRAQLEVAYVYAKGGYGEVRVGRDSGAAARAAETAPSVFNYAKTTNTRLDPTGRAYVRTDHDLTGPATKISYTSPRLLGVEVAVSVTPDADTRGLDRDPKRNVSGTKTHIEDAAEIGLNVSRRLPQGGARLKFGLGYSQADMSSATTAGKSNIETWSAGARIEGESLAIGASVLTSTSGNNEGAGDYQAWDLGVTKSVGPWKIGISYGAAEDDLIGLDSDEWGIGVGRRLSDRAEVSIGWIEQENAFRRNTLAEFPSDRGRSGGIVVEITLLSL